MFLYGALAGCVLTLVFIALAMWLVAKGFADVIGDAIMRLFGH